jgi:segregation and condensation protein A
MNYSVDLDVFRGPLDLLLFLVRKDELDIFDIPIARVTEQYLSYLRILEAVEIDLVGDFLVMATTLMEIKSRMLLPHDPEENGGDTDPRTQLVRQLLEYKKFRDAAERLQELAEEQRRRFSRVPVERFGQDVGPAQEPIRDVELWDLVSAFGRLMRQTLSLAPRSIVYDETPIEVYMDEILALLAEQRQIRFADLLTPPCNRSRTIGRLLAVLELMKARKIRAEQDEPFGEIRLSILHSDRECVHEVAATQPTASA